MALLDKVKAQAEALADKAQHGVTQGKERIEDLQAKKHLDGLLRDLGEAVHAHRRHDGTEANVDRALEAVDTHMREQSEAPPSHAAIETRDRFRPRMLWRGAGYSRNSQATRRAARRRTTWRLEVPRS
jgi:hypothetical protein